MTKPTPEVTEDGFTIIRSDGDVLFVSPAHVVKPEQVGPPGAPRAHRWLKAGENCYSRTSPPPESVEEEIDLLVRRLRAVEAGSKNPELLRTYRAELEALRASQGA